MSCHPCGVAVEDHVAHTHLELFSGCSPECVEDQIIERHGEYALHEVILMENSAGQWIAVGYE